MSSERHDPPQAPRGWRAALRHAFAVDPPGPAEPTAEQRDAVEWLCRKLARRGMTTPSLMLLEMSRPLNAVASAGMQAMQPAVWAIASGATTAHFEQLAAYLERRGSIEWMATRVEQIARERDDPGGRSPGGESGGPSERAAAPRTRSPADPG
ncbi:MAG: hypothetical protein U0575_00395 [Phycisphaerales bacterium]